MRWMIEEAKLGPDQREIIEEIGKANGEPIWVQGHAGSGKSVVLLHALSDYLIRNKRANVMVVVYTHSLVDLLTSGLRQIPALKGVELPEVTTIWKMDNKLKYGHEYDAIFCDEVQDLPLSFIRKMHEQCNQLVLAGDSAQSIYDKTLGERPATKDQLLAALNPKELKCKTIYRMTPSVLELLKKVFPELLQDKTYEGKEDSVIRLFKADNRLKEIDFIWNDAKELNDRRPSEINAILFFSKPDLIEFINRVLTLENKPIWKISHVPGWKNERKEYNFQSLNEHLTKVKCPIMFVSKGFGSLESADNQNKIVVMSYHSAKGLDFDSVSLPFINTSIGGSLDKRKALCLVALSRAKRDLLLTFTGQIQYTYQKFLEGIEIHDIGDDSEEEELLF